MKKIKDRILHNLPLKILAVVVSTILWLVVINLNDPVIDKPYSGIKVDLINDEQLIDDGKVYEILEDTGTVSVTVRAPRSVIESLSIDDIHAVADLSKISVSDTVEIVAYSDRNSENIEEISIPNDFLKLKIENALARQVYITPEITGIPAEDYIIGEVTTSQNIVRLSGPESLMTRVKDAVVTVDVSDMTSSISTNTEIRLYDADGYEINSDYITKNVDSVSVNAQILATKVVPILYATSGDVATGYVLNGEISSNPSSVLIAGTEEDLAEVSNIRIPDSELDVTGIETDLVQVVDITDYFPSGIVLGNQEYSGMATATVGVVRESYSTYVYDEQSLIINNGSSDFEITIRELPNGLPLEVAGLEATLNTLSAANVSAEIDMNDLLAVNGWDELRAGTYEMQIEVSLPDDVRMLRPASVVILVEEIEEAEADQ